MNSKNINEIIKDASIFVSKYCYEIKMSLKKYCEKKKYNNLDEYYKNLLHLIKKLEKNYKYKSLLKNINNWYSLINYIYLNINLCSKEKEIIKTLSIYLFFISKSINDNNSNCQNTSDSNCESDKECNYCESNNECNCNNNKNGNKNLNNSIKKRNFIEESNNINKTQFEKIINNLDKLISELNNFISKYQISNNLCEYYNDLVYEYALIIQDLIEEKVDYFFNVDENIIKIMDGDNLILEIDRITISYDDDIDEYIINISDKNYNIKNLFDDEDFNKNFNHNIESIKELTENIKNNYSKIKKINFI